MDPVIQNHLAILQAKKMWSVNFIAILNLNSYPPQTTFNAKILSLT